MDYLDIFKRNKKIKKIQLPPPYSERFQPSDMSLIDNLLNFNSTTTSNAAGTNYTEEYVKKEEEELLQVFYYFFYFILLYINNINLLL